MEEETKVTKKNNNPLLIIGLAAVLIICGIALIVTGNNKSFLSKDKENDTPAPVDPEPTPEPDPIDDGQRGIVPHALSDETALQLLVEKKESDFADATWSLGVVKVIGHDEKDEKFLVEYEEYAEDSTISTKQTIISVVNGEQSVELPGWVEGERDITVYNFIMYDEESTDPEPTVPVEQDPTVPVEQDPTVPVEQDPTVPVEQDPTAPVEQDSTAPVEPEPTTPVEPEPTTPTDPTVVTPEQLPENTDGNTEVNQ